MVKNKKKFEVFQYLTINRKDYGIGDSDDDDTAFDVILNQVGKQGWEVYATDDKKYKLKRKEI